VKQRDPEEHIATHDQNELPQSIVGSLIDTYPFKTGGLVKKTISVLVSGVAYHLVSYYTVDDIMHQRLSTPGDMYGLEDVAYQSASNLQRLPVIPVLYGDRGTTSQDTWTARQIDSGGETSMAPWVLRVEPNRTAENETPAVTSHQRTQVPESLAWEPGDEADRWWTGTYEHWNF
jgi:Gti1/Pac2 family